MENKTRIILKAPEEILLESNRLVAKTKKKGFCYYEFAGTWAEAQDFIESNQHAEFVKAVAK